MTTTPQSPSAHRQHLLAAFSPKTIEAFEGLIDDRLGLVIGDSDGLVAQLRDVLKEARVSDDPAAKKTASRAVQPVKEAAAATKVAAASGDIRDIADAAEKVAVAKPLVDEAQAAVNAAVERHEAILKPLNPDDLLDLAKRPRSRLDDIEAGVQASAVASAEALAIAGSSNKGPSIPVWGFSMLLVMLVFFGVVDIVSDSVPFFWEGFGWAALAAVVTMVVMFLADLIHGPAREGYSQARAQSSARADARRQHDDEPDEDVTQYDPEPRQQPADAQASTTAR